jgi:hypothetical protein
LKWKSQWKNNKNMKSFGQNLNDGLLSAATAILNGSLQEENYYDSKMIENQLKTIVRNAQACLELSQSGKEFPEWAQSEVAVAADMLVDVAQFMSSHSSKEEGGDSVTEALDPSDDAGVWIRDFIDSKNPMFDGKSKKERIRMALGAWYGAQK